MLTPVAAKAVNVSAVSLAAALTAEATERFPLGPSWFWSLVVLLGCVGGLLRYLEHVIEDDEASLAEFTHNVLSGGFAGFILAAIAIGFKWAESGFLLLAVSGITGMFSKQFFTFLAQRIKKVWEKASAEDG